MNKEDRHYAMHFGGAMIAYSLVLVGSITAIRNGELSGWSAGLASLTPLIPAFFALRVFMLHFRRLDEFRQRLIAESILWATGIVGFACFAYGFLAGAVELPEIGLIWVLPSICGVFGIAHAILYWQANR